MVLLYLLCLFSFFTPFLFFLSRFALFKNPKKKTRTETKHITHTKKMLLGKRQRPPINRTTSLSEITFDLNLPCESEQQNPRQNQAVVVGPYGSNGQLIAAVDQRLLSMVTPRGNPRRHSGDFSDAGHFLRSCSLCERLLVPGRDIYMYRGDTAFCSLECRQEQMGQDERKEKGKSVKESTVAATAKSGKGGRAAAAV